MNVRVSVDAGWASAFLLDCINLLFLFRFHRCHFNFQLVSNIWYEVYNAADVAKHSTHRYLVKHIRIRFHTIGDR